jgi:polyhydroxyalkanoate synthesis regulator phasin
MSRMEREIEILQEEVDDIKTYGTTGLERMVEALQERVEKLEEYLLPKIKHD